MLAVIDGGMEYVNSGSTIAMRGYNSLLRILTFTLCSVEAITALHVTSAPVPAVVGIAMYGAGGLLISLPLPITSKYSISSPLLFINAEIAFPESMTLPPPIPMTRLHFSCFALSTASMILFTVGSLLMLNTVVVILELFKFLIIDSIRVLFFPHITNAFLPKVPAIIGRFLIAPLPKII